MPWLEFGYDEQSFWHMTPRQVDRAVSARGKTLIREQNERAWLAWHIAALTRSKRLPDLKKLLYKPPRKQQTWQEQLAIAEMYAAIGFGKITRPRRDN
jgi:hypothetical protein